MWIRIPFSILFEIARLPRVTVARGDPPEKGASKDSSGICHFVSKYQYNLFFIRSKTCLIKPGKEKFFLISFPYYQNYRPDLIEGSSLEQLFKVQIVCMHFETFPFDISYLFKRTRILFPFFNHIFRLCFKSEFFLVYYYRFEEIL